MHRRLSQNLVRPHPILKHTRCAECKTSFFAKRSTATFCSDLCRQRAFQAKHSQKAAERSALIVRVLKKLGFIGQVAPVYRRDPTPPTFALTVPRTVAAAEVSVFWTVTPLSTEEVAEALKLQGILDVREAVPGPVNAKTLPRLPDSGIRNANSPKTSMKSNADKSQKWPISVVEQNQTTGA